LSHSDLPVRAVCFGLLSGCSVPAVLSRLDFPGSRLQAVLYGPDSPVLEVAFCLHCLLSLFLLIHWLSCPGCLVLTCPGSHFLVSYNSILLWLSYPSSPVLAALSWQSCPGSPVLDYPGCPVLAVLSWQACPGSCVLAVRSWQSCPGSPVLTVLS
jgi:hypothetical protein